MKTFTISMLILGLCLSMQPQEIRLKKTTNHLNPDTYAVYALKHKQKVGSISWMGNGIIELKVAQAYRNQGIGGRLFCYALSEIKNKYDHAYWYAVDSIDFYRRFGAEVIYPQDAESNQAIMMHFDFKQHGNPAINCARYKTQKNNLSRNMYGL